MLILDQELYYYLGWSFNSHGKNLSMKIFISMSLDLWRELKISWVKQKEPLHCTRVVKIKIYWTLILRIRSDTFFFFFALGYNYSLYLIFHVLSVSMLSCLLSVLHVALQQEQVIELGTWSLLFLRKRAILLGIYMHYKCFVIANLYYT